MFLPVTDAGQWDIMDLTAFGTFILSASARPVARFEADADGGSLVTVPFVPDDAVVREPIRGEDVARRTEQWVMSLDFVAFDSQTQTRSMGE